MADLVPRGTDITSPQLKTFLERIKAGDTIAQAAGAAGATPGVFYARANKDTAVYDQVFAAMYAEAIEERALVKADGVDAKFEEWIEDPTRSDSLRIAWAKRWHPAYRDKQEAAGGGTVVIKIESAFSGEIVEVREDGDDDRRALPGDTEAA